MGFCLHEDHDMIREMVKSFAEQECAPGVSARDEQEAFPMELWKQCGELGLAGITLPEAYGGIESDYLSYGIAIEELSKVDPSLGAIVSAHSGFCCTPILLFGTDEQKKKYLTPLATGMHLGALGLTESFSGTDISGIQTTAVRDGDEYVINGSKIFTTNGYYADTYVITAQVDNSKGNQGIAAFILEKGTPGFRFGRNEKKMGLRSSAMYELIFEDVRIPAGNLLGEEGQGFEIAMKTLDYGRIGIAAQALGIARGAYEAAAKYSKERRQFGKTLSEFQNIQFKLADMALEIETARLLVYQTCQLATDNKPISKHSAMAKLYASDVCNKIAREAVQILGGYGFSREYLVERFMRDGKATEIFGGTSEMQRMIIAGHVLGEF